MNEGREITTEVLKLAHVSSYPKMSENMSFLDQREIEGATAFSPMFVLHTLYFAEPEFSVVSHSYAIKNNFKSKCQKVI